MKPKILFIFDHQKPEQLEVDGLWSALNLLEKDFEIVRHNLATDDTLNMDVNPDFTLGWGAFDSRVDNQIRAMTKVPTGLCLGGMFKPNETASNYDVIFYETEAHKRFLEEQGVKTKFVHAFGINTDIYKKLQLIADDPFVGCDYPKIWDNISVGSFSPWHRQDLLYDIPGVNLAIGTIDGGNIQESFNYVANLTNRNWMVSNWVPAETLAKFYNMSKKAYLTAEFGQERACLEARACELEVIVPEDNPKLKELLTSPIYDHIYYAEQLNLGIMGVLNASR